jgi:hypothetical protein
MMIMLICALQLLISLLGFPLLILLLLTLPFVMFFHSPFYPYSISTLFPTFSVFHNIARHTWILS